MTRDAPPVAPDAAASDRGCRYAAPLAPPLRDSTQRLRRGVSDRSGADATREAGWVRLDALLGRAGGRLASLDGDEIGELGRRYRAATTELALARASSASIADRERLNDLVARAHALIYAAPPEAGSGARTWVVALLSSAGAVRRAWRYHLVAAALLLVGAAYGWIGAARDTDWALEVTLQPGDERTPYATREELRATLLQGRPSADGSGHGVGEKAVFAAFLWQHNTRAALLAFFAGPLAGVPTATLLIYNGMILGAYSHTFVARGLAWEWWAWLLPHGVTELLAIVLLAGGGLWLGRIMVAPGERTRREALREVRPDILRHALLAFPMLFVAAGIESFVRQSGMTEPERYAFAAASALFWTLWIGWARPPASWLLALSAEASTRAERGASRGEAAPDDGLSAIEEALSSR